MAVESRVKKSILNARMNTICYFLSLIIAFFTRNVLLNHLGAEFIGLTGTLGSLLGFLNLAELGVGTAIGYVLYKPIFDQNHPKINEIISVFGYIYRQIGTFILVCGIILSLFLPLIFSKTNIPTSVLYVGFYAYLFASMLAYFVNYKFTLLAADQKNYIITGYFQICTSIKVILQMVFAIYYANFYLYFLLEIIFSSINAIILQWKINQTYPWLASEVKMGKQLFKKYPEIVKYIKQLFVHKIATFVQFQLSPFLIYAYVSLPMVAMYTNYTLITERVKGLVSGVMSSTHAGVGSLISEGDLEKAYKVYKELLSIRIFVASIITFCIYILISPFVGIWLGEEYILSRIVVILISLHFFMLIAREINDQFIFGFGLFYDVWAPITESILFIVFSIIMGAHFGLTGVLTGPIISMMIIVFMWKPYFLFTKGFKKSVLFYIFHSFKNLFLSFIAMLISLFIYNASESLFSFPNPWIIWILKALFVSIIITISSILLYISFSPDFRGFCYRLVSRTKIFKDFS